MGTVVVANLPTLIGRACKCDLLYVKVAVQPDYGLWMFVAACAFGSVCQMWICFCTDVAAHSVTLPGWPNPSPKRLYLCRSYRGEGDLEGEFLRRRRLSPCLARPGDLERDNDLDREDSARRPYLLPGDRGLPIFRCAPMHAAVKRRRRAAVEGQCQLLSSEKTPHRHKVSGRYVSGKVSGESMACTKSIGIQTVAARLNLDKKRQPGPI